MRAGHPHQRRSWLYRKALGCSQNVLVSKNFFLLIFFLSKILIDLLTTSQNAKQQSPEATANTPEPSVESPSQPPNKRRRPKRNEEERIAYLRNDPYVAQFEAYRVLCACCDKWIRLRPNSTYCSIPWDAHRKSCLAKKA